MARLVRERCGGWPPERAGDGGADGSAAGDVAEDDVATGSIAAGGVGLAPADGAGPAAGADGEVLLVCGATGAGKSAVGFDVFLRQLRAGIAAAYEAEALERSGLGDLRIDTGGRIVAEVADLIAGRW